jgi:hypothetical protein
MSGLKRASYFFMCVWTAFLFGIAAPLLGLGVNKLAGSSLFSSTTLLVFYCIGVVLVSSVFIAGTVRQIRESKERMQDPAYRDLLRKMGLLSGRRGSGLR